MKGDDRHAAVRRPSGTAAKQPGDRVRIGVVSDIHCNVQALSLALKALEGEVDAVWCAGDIVLQYRFCGETTRMLRDASTTAIQGNHDTSLLGPAGVRARTRVGGQEDELAWLAALPLIRREHVGGRRVLMVHGNPWEPYGDYLPPHDPRWHNADTLCADLVITGHTHVPMVKKVGNTLVVNPGSVGEPRQQDDRRGTYAVIDTATMEAEIQAIHSSRGRAGSGAQPDQRRDR